MSLFKSKTDFEYIEKRRKEAELRFKNIEKGSNDKKNIGNIKPYSKSLKFLYNTFIYSKANKSGLKSYITDLELTKGDYKKRNNKIFNKVSLMYSFVNEVIDTGDNTHNSLLGVYKDAFEILNSTKYTNMFKKVFTLIDKKGENNTSLTLFKLAYVALSYMVESSLLYLIDFELEVYNGKTPRSAILDTMTDNRSYMKHIVIPTIEIIAFIKSLSNPVAYVQRIDSEETKIETKSKEDGNVSDESVGSNILTGLSLLGVSLSGVPVYIIAILALLALIPFLRSSIYWMSVKNIDVGKELLLKSEMLDNNIVLLKQKLDNTTDPKEREKLEKIIEKQQVWVNKWKDESQKRLKDDIKTDYEIESTIKKEDSSKDLDYDIDIIL